MASGARRHYQGKRKRQDEPVAVPSTSFNGPVADEFIKCKSELDDKHDRHERLVKLSRDITIESKRAIFLLHRAQKEKKAEVLQEARQMLDKIINGPLKRTALELEGHDPYRYLRAYSAGLQEFVEAVSFLYFLQTDTLITINDINQQLTYPSREDNSRTSIQYAAGTSTELPDTHIIEENKQDVELSPPFSVPLSQMNFMLGIADLTGELMRRAISSIGLGDKRTSIQLCEILQIMEGYYKIYCSTAGTEMRRKIQTLSHSVAKVENACYTLKLRGSEMPQHLLSTSISNQTHRSAATDDADV